MPAGRPPTTSGETETSESYFGTDGKPCLHKDGNAGWKASYDERGNKTSASYFGIDGKPCRHSDGNTGWKATYDERGNETSESFFDADGKLCRLTYGYAEEGALSMRAETKQAGPVSTTAAGR